MATIKHGPAPEDHFSLIANDLARDPRISLRAKGVYLYLRSHRDGWSMSVDRIAEALEVSRRTITSSVKELEEHGYLIREQTNGEKGQFGASNYTVLSQPIDHSPLAENLRTAPPAQTPQNPSSQPVAKNEHTAPPAETNKPAGRTVRKKTVNGEFAQHKKTNSSKKTKTQENQKEECARAHRLPDNWMPSQQVIHTIQAEAPHLNLEYEHAKFTDYWQSLGGQRARKVNWDATWRLWMRRQAEKTNPRQHQKSKSQQYLDLGEKLVRQKTAPPQTPQGAINPPF